MFFQQPVGAENKVSTVPAPIGGLNAYDSLAAMPQTDAIIMENWWPQSYGCKVRNGYRRWATGLLGSVGTLSTWSSQTGEIRLIAWAGGGVYNITTRGPASPPVLEGLASDYWESVVLTNAAGTNLIAVNGIDDGLIIQGSGVAARITSGNGTDPLTWAGLNPRSAVQLTVHQHRLWAVEKDSTNGWFLPPDAIQGTFLKYNFGALFERGGYLQFLTTWTIDDGNGAEDHLIAVSSRGEAVVFGGTDPEDDMKWTLVGVYYVGAPVEGRRGHTKAGGDQILLTQQGAVSMAAMLVSTKVNETQNPLVSKKIQFLISDLITKNGNRVGWSVNYVPKHNIVIINVPQSEGLPAIQLAANQITGSWTTFSGMNATCWGGMNSLPFFGDALGNVYSAWDGNKDDVLLDDTGGKGIISNVQQAYSYMGSMAAQKQVGMYRPTFVSDEVINYNSSILYDFATATLATPLGTTAVPGALWDVSLWDTGRWAGGSSVVKTWVQAEGIGVATSIRMVAQTEGEVLWVATDYSTLPGIGLF